MSDLRTITVPQALELSTGELVPSIRAVVSDIGRRYSGTNDHGDWSLQNITLKDGVTGQTIKAKVNDREEIPASWKGGTVLMSCKNSDKGLTGLKIDEDDYRGKKSKVIKVTPSATILPDNGSAAPVTPQAAPAPQAATVTPQTALAPQAPPADVPAATHEHSSSHDGNGDPVKAARKSLARAANLYVLCMDAGTYVKEQLKARHSVEMTDAQYQACVSALFINASRDQLDSNLPTGKL